MRIRSWKFSLFQAWYDLWVGVFYSRKQRTLYVCLLPCLGFKIEFGHADMFPKGFVEDLDLIEKINTDPGSMLPLDVKTAKRLMLCRYCGEPISRMFISRDELGKNYAHVSCHAKHSPAEVAESKRADK